MARARKNVAVVSGDLPAAEQEEQPSHGAVLMPGAPAEVEIRRPADLRLDVLVELSRMAHHEAGGNCVLFRRAPAVAPELEAEIRRLCLAIPGSKEVRGIPSYCFERDAELVIGEIMARLGREGAAA